MIKIKIFIKIMKNKKIFLSKFYILIIFIVLSLINSLNYISMKLQNYNKELIKNIPEHSFTIEHFVNITIENSIYTTIKIGNPNQEVKTWIDADEYSYFLFKDTCILDSFFNENNSLTFEQNNNETFFYHGYSQTVYVNETFTLKNDINENNKEIDIINFPIMFMKDPKNDKRFNDLYPNANITNKTCATIGFSILANYNDKTSKNFIVTLKEKEIIDDYTIFIEYDKNGDEQYLIIGGYPEDIFINKYDVKNQHTTYIQFYYTYINQWGLNFDRVLSGEDQVIYQTEAGIHHNLGVIYGVKEYLSLIERSYFNYYCNLKICEKKVYKDYTIFVCDREKFNIEKMKKFPELIFKNADLNESFVLTYEDVFFTKGNNVYFLIVFHRILKEVWEFGRPFLAKYEFAFNFDSKLIWYYKKLNNDGKEQDKNNKTKSKSFFDNEFILLGIILVLSIVLGIICFFIGRMFYNKNKKKLIKAEELDQEFNYEEYEKNNIN